MPASSVGRRARFLGALVLGLGLGSCFSGAEREKEAPPGYPGGFCLAPDGWCRDGLCDLDGAFCYDPLDPCRGFFCGGTDRAICDPSSTLPVCLCLPGFNNAMFPLYCCPDDGFSDPRCAAGGPTSGGPSTSGGETSSDTGSTGGSTGTSG